jgi:hypothetical protein
MMKPDESHATEHASAVIPWLLDSDPSICWQVLCDLMDAPAAEVAAERARVARQGCRHRDGRWRLDVQDSGTMPIDFGEDPGRPSRWLTLRALRALSWYCAEREQPGWERAGIVRYDLR